MLTKLFTWPKGTKRNIAHIYWAVISPALLVLWPEGVPTNINKAYVITGIILTAAGYGHAAIKSMARSDNRKISDAAVESMMGNDEYMKEISEEGKSK